MNLQSPKVTVSKSAEYIFNSLTNVENYEKLMPETISKFEVLDHKSYIFALTGMPEIKLVIKEQFPFNKIILGAASEKLPFTLDGNINALSDDSCEIELIFQGDFNPMMAMMIKGPITKFIETLVNNMHKL